jgi:hypothetical protein
VVTGNTKPLRVVGDDEKMSQESTVDIIITLNNDTVTSMTRMHLNSTLSKDDLRKLLTDAIEIIDTGASPADSIIEYLSKLR